MTTRDAKILCARRVKALGTYIDDNNYNILFLVFAIIEFCGLRFYLLNILLLYTIIPITITLYVVMIINFLIIHTIKNLTHYFIIISVLLAYKL